MRLGIFQNIQWPETTVQETQFANAIEQALLAERLGFHAAYFVEHHWTRHGILSSTLAVLSYLAARTTTLRLGTAVLVLPFHNPARLVEEAATVDILSKGRLELGVGRGFQWAEFNGFNMSLEESAARSDEAIEFIMRAWTEPDRFDFEGRFWKYNDISVEPRPLQKPHPPVWVASGSPESAIKVGRLGLRIQFNSGIPKERVPEMVAAYRAGLDENGHAFSKDNVLISRMTHIAETRELAWERAMPYFGWFRKWVGIVTPAPGGPPRGMGHALVPNLDKPIGSTEGDPGYLFCTPDECARYIEELESMGVGNVIFQGNWGGIPQELTENSLGLIGREVIPHFAASAVS